jgi:hypothetical protein
MLIAWLEKIIFAWGAMGETGI